MDLKMFSWRWLPLVSHLNVLRCYFVRAHGMGCVSRQWRPGLLYQYNVKWLNLWKSSFHVRVPYLLILSKFFLKICSDLIQRYGTRRVPSIAIRVTLTILESKATNYPKVVYTWEMLFLLLETLFGTYIFHSNTSLYRYLKMSQTSSHYAKV